MANYPDKTQVVGSEVTPLDGSVLERSESGRARIRSFYEDLQYEITVVHEVDGPDKDDIWNHFLTHRGTQFQFVFHGGMTTYTCMYIGPPKAVPIAGDDRWQVTTKLVTV